MALDRLINNIKYMEFKNPADNWKPEESKAEIIRRNQEKIERREVGERWKNITVQLSRAINAIKGFSDDEMFSPAKASPFMGPLSEAINLCTKTEMEKEKKATTILKEEYTEYKNFVDALGKNLMELRSEIVANKTFDTFGQLKSQHQIQTAVIEEGTRIVEEITKKGELVKIG